MGAPRVTTYLVEAYLPRTSPGGPEAAAARARAAAAQLRREGAAIRFLRSFFVPEDELCFCLFEAASIGEVAEAVRRAAMSAGRIQPAIELLRTAVTSRHGSLESTEQSAAARGARQTQEKEER
jgi:hypothetical protein